MKLVIVIISGLTLLIIIRKNRKDKLEFLYNNVISLGYNVFFKASKQFLFGNNLLNEDRNKERTTSTDYVILLNNVNRCKIMFNKKSRFSKYLNLLSDECINKLNGNSHHFYDEKDKEHPKKKIIDPLYELYKKYSKIGYTLCDYPQL